MTWHNCEDELPRDMQPVWTVNAAHRNDLALAIYYNDQKGFILLGGPDALNGLDVTHWAGVRLPAGLPRKPPKSKPDQLPENTKAA